jgi:hypothetical protein
VRSHAQAPDCPTFQLLLAVNSIKLFRRVISAKTMLAIEMLSVGARAE